MTALAADRSEIGRFYGTLFLYADPGGYVSLRTFEHDPTKPPVDIRPVRINGEGLAPVIAKAAGAANRAARHARPVVFAPPPCTFANPRHAAEADLHNGLVIVAECDAAPAHAQARLRGLLGSPTLVAESGGVWTDPRTGELQPKLHVYFRLAEPTRDATDHARLKRANRLVAALTGSDPSATSLVHPLRLPGSIHRKAEPKRCRIVELDHEREVELGDALERLEQAAALALEHADGPEADRLRAALDTRESGGRAKGAESDPDARDADLEALADGIPNDDAPWSEYRNVGLGFFAASGGSAAGLNAYDRWARKSGKYDGRTASDWERLGQSPPGRTGKGALVKRARLADPGFRLPSWGPERASTAGAAAPTVEATPWPDPLDIIGAPELVGWPTLTADCLPAPLHSYVVAESERLNVDPCPLAAHTVAACSAAISDALAIRPKRHDTWTQHARIWTCVVKDVGARGTEMIRAAFWPLRERDAALFDAWRQEHASWKAGQDSTPRGGVRPTDPEPKCRRLVTNDATLEAMSDILQGGDEHAKLTLVCDELVSFLGGFGRYTDRGAANRALMLEAYDGGPQRIDRIRRGHVFVPNWSVVVAGNIQPRRLAGMAENLVDDGLFQRFLTIHTRPALLGVDDDRAINPGVGRGYRELHAALAALRPVMGAEGDPLPCFCDDDGHAVRRGFMRLVERLQVDPTLPTVIRETAPKWSGLLARLTLVFHLVTIAETRLAGAILADRDLCRVSGPTVAMAATFLRRVALPNLFRLGFETMPEEGAPAAHARWLAGHVLAHKAQDITARDIGRAYRPLRGRAHEIADTMAILVDAGWAVPVEGRQDGSRWSINPGVHERFAAAATHEKARRLAVKDALRTKVSEL